MKSSKRTKIAWIEISFDRTASGFHKGYLPSHPRRNESPYFSTYECDDGCLKQNKSNAGRFGLGEPARRWFRDLRQCRLDSHLIPNSQRYETGPELKRSHLFPHTGSLGRVWLTASITAWER
jgi:hypothetical protein